GKQLQNHHGGMILLGDYLYCGHGHNSGLPICIEFATGEIVWGPTRGAGDGSAAVVFADGHLYFRYENGKVALVEATPDEYRLKSEFKMATNNGKSWPHPVIADGKLYLRDKQSLLCYAIRK
ncbi:MAG: polyvinylalcohol dehydrogenase, partial [Pirellulaceae bacterium]